MIYRFGYTPDNKVTAQMCMNGADVVAVISREGGMLQDSEILCTNNAAAAKEIVDANFELATSGKDAEFAAYAAAIAACYQDLYGNGGAPESRLYQACEKTRAFHKMLGVA